MLAALKLTHPNLIILMGPLESRASGYALSELKRLSAKLFGHQFLEASEGALRIESEQGEAIANDTDEYGETTVDSFAGTDGETYELRKIRPKKTTTEEGPPNRKPETLEQRGTGEIVEEMQPLQQCRRLQMAAYDADRRGIIGGNVAALSKRCSRFLPATDRIIQMPEKVPRP